VKARWRGLALAASLFLLALVPVGVQNQTTPAPAFARLIESLSEPGGEFDTDNLISNEKSYLHVIPALERDGVAGGVYIGVGPDQNFSYIARIRPSLAFIVDIRRDNLLMHLLFKALFEAGRNRLEYLSLLTGRVVPQHAEAWRNASIQQIVKYIDQTEAAPAAPLKRRLHRAISRYGVSLSAGDLATIDRFHQAFVDEGLSLQFQSFGRPPRSYYPMYRDLLLETDRNGRQANYLASEDDYQFLRTLEAEDRIIPVVGDLSGPHAVTAIGKLMAERGERLSAFYVSNVEMYLFRGGSFGRYVENLGRLPHTSTSVIIRSIFGGYALADSVPGYYSTSTTHNLDDLLAAYAGGRYRTYSDVLLRRQADRDR
jgi:hypothetical protein